MTIKIKNILFIILFAIPITIFADNKMQIEIFTDSNHPVDAAGITDAQINYNNLDSVQKITKHFEAEIERMPKMQALGVLKRIFTNNKEQFKHAYSILFKANQYGLTKYPAIIFDRKVVVYGETNLDRAVLEYKEWQK